jgi:Fe/S biogenesis protein NfuA
VATGVTAIRVQPMLDHQINLSIAAHSGVAELVDVEGIEQAIMEAIPEITSMIDVTDHASGRNPYYEPAKK